MRNLTGVKHIVKVNDVIFGGDVTPIIAGPCAIESREQIMTIAKGLREAGADMLRGGAFKPRTRPFDFQGLGEKGLMYMKEASESYDLPMVTELMDEYHLDMILNYTDVIQVGSRNMHNYGLLKRLASVDKPILLKRGMSATIHEWIMAVEYLAIEGKRDIILCERGIRTFETYTRNTLDLSAIPIMKMETGLPVISDPSHGTGVRELVLPMSMASLGAGADGLMVEVHYDPDASVSDAKQTIDLATFKKLVEQVKK